MRLVKEKRVEVTTRIECRCGSQNTDGKINDTYAKHQKAKRVVTFRCWSCRMMFTYEGSPGKQLRITAEQPFTAYFNGVRI